MYLFLDFSSYLHSFCKQQTRLRRNLESLNVLSDLGRVQLFDDKWKPNLMQNKTGKVTSDSMTLKERCWIFMVWLLSTHLKRSDSCQTELCVPLIYLSSWAIHWIKQILLQHKKLLFSKASLATCYVHVTMS